jgi:anti-sigma factor ChrR (cupin superfamily)
VSGPSLFLDSSALPWRETAYPGIRWKKLRYDPVAGEAAVLLEFAPGTAYGAHRHPGGEEYWVLEGSLEDGGRTYGPGTYVHHPPGSEHEPSSAEGCVVFVSLRAAVEML